MRIFTSVPLFAVVATRSFAESDAKAAIVATLTLGTGFSPADYRELGIPRSLWIQ